MEWESSFRTMPTPSSPASRLCSTSIRLREQDLKWTFLLLESSGQAENKKLKRSPSLGREEPQALCSARDPSPPECAARHHEPTVASPNARGSPAPAAQSRAPAPDAASPAGGLEVLRRAQGGCQPGLLPLGPHHCVLCSCRTCGCKRSPICPSG